MGGACAFKASVEMSPPNKKCIASMMKEEGPATVKMSLACMNEIADCYNEDFSFDEKCFEGEIQENRACLAALMAMPKESESEESSSSSEEVVEVTFSMMNFKKFKDCAKGKKEKRNGTCDEDAGLQHGIKGGNGQVLERRRCIL